jgi:hypothetical protein
MRDGEYAQEDAPASSEDAGAPGNSASPTAPDAPGADPDDRPDAPGAEPDDRLDAPSDASAPEAPETTGPDTTPDAGPSPTAPPRVWLTVAEIPPAMNGSLDSILSSLAWRLRVNRSFFTLDAYRAPESGPVDWAASRIACDDGTGLREVGPLEVMGTDHARVLVAPPGSGAALAEGPVVCALSAFAPDGRTSEAAFAFDAATLPPDLDPFPAPETWLVTFTRDIFRTTVTPRGDQTAAVTSTHVPAGDGVPDLDEALFALGLASPDHPEATARVRADLARRVAALTRRFYGLDRPDDPRAPRLVFAFEGEPEAAPLLVMTPAALDAEGVSRIAVGGDGDAEDQVAGTFGRAWLDWNNQTPQDNTRHGVGVFPTALARAALNQPIAALLLGACRPDLGGVPFGASPHDAAFIGLEVPPGDLPEASLERAELYGLVMRFVALGLASILAHEVGHSLGLVPSGPPPHGLFAEVSVDFVASVTTAAHIDLPGLNLMQTGGSAQVGEILSGAEPAFEPLSLAYLRRMLVVGPVLD